MAKNKNSRAKSRHSAVARSFEIKYFGFVLPNGGKVAFHPIDGAPCDCFGKDITWKPSRALGSSLGSGRSLGRGSSPGR